MNYTTIRPNQADVGMLVMGAIFDRVIIAVEQEGLNVAITFDDLETRIYEPFDILHVQTTHRRRYEESGKATPLIPHPQ